MSVFGDFMIGEAVELRRQLATKDTEIAYLKQQLQALTPGGSEFHDDPKRCLAWIKERLNGPFVKFKVENETLTRQLKEANERWNSTYDVAVQAQRQLDEATAERDRLQAALNGEQYDHAADKIEFRKQLEEANSALIKETHAHLQTIDERDHHEESINSIAAALGLECEWSNLCDVGKECIEAAEEARKDTERLDWLSDRKYACFGTNYHDGRWCIQIETEGYAERGISLREAIDAAREGK